MGLLALAYLADSDRAQARHWAEQALRSRSGPISGLGVYDGCLAPAEVLCVLAEAEPQPQPRRSLIQLAGRALVPALHYAMIFPIDQPRAALVCGMYAQLRGHVWLARRLFERSLSAARELAMPHEAQRAQSALAGLADPPP